MAPAGAYGRFTAPGELTLTAMVAMPTGSPLIKRTLTRRVTEPFAATALGEELALLLRDR